MLTWSFAWRIELRFEVRRDMQLKIDAQSVVLAFEGEDDSAGALEP